jgi:hypothetical protein
VSYSSGRAIPLNIDLISMDARRAAHNVLRTQPMRRTPEDVQSMHAVRRAAYDVLRMERGV